MPKPYIEDRATMAPSKCVVSGSGDGPIINTTMNYGDDKGRIYIAPRSIAHLLRELGWIDPTDAKNLRETNVRVQESIKEARKELEKLRALKEAVDGLVDKPEPVIKEVVRTEQRDPTPEEVAEFISKNPNHPVVKDHQRPEKGSREEWEKLYGKKGPLSKSQQQAKKDEEQRRAMKNQQQATASSVDTHVDSEPTDNDPDVPAKVVQLHGQDVDLDELLGQTVKDIKAYIEGHPDDFLAAVKWREEYNAALAGKDPRVTLISAIDSELEADSE